MRPRGRNGTRYLGMSPRGGIAEPPWPLLQRNRRGLSMRSPALRADHDHIELPFTQFLFAEATLDDQHEPRRQQKHQHDFAECGLVEPPEQL